MLGMAMLTIVRSSRVMKKPRDRVIRIAHGFPRHLLIAWGIRTPDKTRLTRHDHRTSYGRIARPLQAKSPRHDPVDNFMLRHRQWLAWASPALDCQGLSLTSGAGA